MAMHSTYADNIMATFTLVDMLFFIRLIFVMLVSAKVKDIFIVTGFFSLLYFLHDVKKEYLKSTLNNLMLLLNRQLKTG